MIDLLGWGFDENFEFFLFMSWRFLDLEFLEESGDCGCSFVAVVVAVVVVVVAVVVGYRVAATATGCACVYLLDPLKCHLPNLKRKYNE